MISGKSGKIGKNKDLEWPVANVDKILDFR